MGDLFRRFRGLILTVVVAVAVLVAVLVIPNDGDDDDQVGAGGGATADETILIGVALPDIEAFARISREYDVGDQDQQIHAVIDGWRQEGFLPHHGRDIRLVIRKYPILNADEKIAVCRAFAQDDDVFAVVAGRSFSEGATCLAQRFSIPVIDTDGVTEQTLEASSPYMFTLRVSHDVLLRNWASWARENGFLDDDSTVGLFYETRLDGVIDGLKNDLAQSGHTPAAELSASGEGVGSPQDTVAIQRFMAEGVNVVMPLVGGSSMIAMQNFAEEQGFRPLWLASDYGTHTADVATSPYPPPQYDGARGMTSIRVGELASGGEITDEAEECLSNYERYSGQEIERGVPETGEWTNVLMICDLGRILRAALENAGEELTRDSFVAGLEQIESLPLGGHADVTYGPGNHSGTDSYRTIEWHADCRCWHAAGDFRQFE